MKKIAVLSVFFSLLPVLPVLAQEPEPPGTVWVFREYGPNRIGAGGGGDGNRYRTIDTYLGRGGSLSRLNAILGLFFGFGGGAPIPKPSIPYVPEKPKRLKDWSEVVSLQAGISTLLIVRSDGSLWTVDEMEGWPVRIALPASVERVACGETIALVLTKDGSIFLLPDGQTPVPVQGLPAGSRPRDVSTGEDFCHVVMEDAAGETTVWGWGLNSGHNEHGELGSGDVQDHFTPVQVMKGPGDPLKEVAGISSRAGHVVALMKDGTLTAWGENRSGQLGVGSTVNSAVAVTVQLPRTAPLDPVQTIAVGSDFTLALRKSGTLLGWGSSRRGQLGSTAAAIYHANPLPLSVPLSGRVVAIAAGYGQSAALVEEAAGKNSLWVWGDSTFEMPHPRRVKDEEIGPRPSAVACGLGMTYVVSNAPAPGAPVTAIPEAVRKAEVPVPGTGPVWWIGDYDPGRRRHWRRPRRQEDAKPVGPVPVEVPVDEEPSAMSIGESQAVLAVGGKVFAFGENYKGQLGDGTTDSRSGLVEVEGPGNVRSLASGTWTTFALCEGGAATPLWRWGGSVYETNPKVLPDLDLLGRLSKVVVGSDHTVVLTESGTVANWGGDRYGELGMGVASGSSMGVWPPRAVSFPGKVTAIAAGGGHHTLALLEDRTAWGWGQTMYGELGEVRHERSPLPQQRITALSGVDMIAAGSSHSVFLAGGAVYCCGSVFGGTLGNGVASEGYDRAEPRPSRVWGLPPVSFIAAGGNRTAAISVDDRGVGRLWLWGRGIGPTPVPVRGLPSVKSVAVGSAGILIVTEKRPD